jgi:hypothetical protein
VRIVVPDGLSLSLPMLYAGKKNRTKKITSDREATEWTAKFLDEFIGRQRHCANRSRPLRR